MQDLNMTQEEKDLRYSTPAIHSPNCALSNILNTHIQLAITRYSWMLACYSYSFLQSVFCFFICLFVCLFCLFFSMLKIWQFSKILILLLLNIMLSH